MNSTLKQILVFLCYFGIFSLTFLSNIPVIAEEEDDGQEVEVDVGGSSGTKKFSIPELTHPQQVYFFESFQSETGEPVEAPDQLGWVLSKAEDYSDQVVSILGKDAAFKGDTALFLKKPHARYGVSKKLQKPFSLDSDQVTIQFEARFHNQLSCSGAYIKFVAEGDDQLDQSKFSEKTPYVLMFGPDKCGANQKLHVIFRHQNPISKEFEEKHMNLASKFENDGFTHVYTLQLKKSDQSVRVLIDREEKALNKATKKKDFKPSFIPAEEIDDPDDKKPDDWEDERIIPDPDAKKPDDWVDEKEIVDPASSRPSDWDDEEDGQWEPLLIKNPDYKGEWEVPMIDNPKYVGEWEPRKIENPNYFEQEFPLSNLPRISHVFIEVLANDEDIAFDNILITTDYDTGKELAEKQALEKQSIEKAEETEKKLQEKKEAREKNLEESFGFFSVLEYAYGEVAELYERYTVPFVISLTGLVLAFIYFLALRDPPPASVSSPSSAKAAKKKKDDEDDDEKETEGKGEEDKKNEQDKSSGSVRRRPRRAD